MVLRQVSKTGLHQRLDMLCVVCKNYHEKTFSRFATSLSHNWHFQNDGVVLSVETYSISVDKLTGEWLVLEGDASIMTTDALIEAQGMETRMI